VVFSISYQKAVIVIYFDIQIHAVIKWKYSVVIK